LCLVPAFFIAGAIASFISQQSVMKYLGPNASKPLAYGMASISGSVLAVCSCTVLPLFAGIYRMGAGLGAATAFLYAGPAINVLAIILTAAVLGPVMGAARAIGAVVFSVVIGLAMHLIFRKAEQAKAASAAEMPEPQIDRPLWKHATFFAVMVAILVVANWASTGSTKAALLCCPGGLRVDREVRGTLVERTDEQVVIREDATGELQRFPTNQIARVEQEPNPIDLYRWAVVAALAVVLAAMLWRWFSRGELGEWVGQSWGFAKQILPLLLAGVLVAGFLLGTPAMDGREGRPGLIPPDWVTSVVGGEGLRANIIASVAGAFMYFATLTEVPILQGLMKAGMGKGPALALLLAGPALSLPNMLVIRSVMGTKKTLVYIVLVVVMATISGLIFGNVVA
ncbi:MAG: permease, partial [Phycisphaerae bacterium]|nr:permease [Phycisphaerae bacterium]